MPHGIHKVTGFTLDAPYHLIVAFEDGEQRRIDFRPVLRGEMYGPLADPAFFSQVSLDPVAHTLVWPNGADFDPETLHEWPLVAEALAQLAATWGPPAA